MHLEILTERKTNHSFSHQVLYEWEDDFRKIFNCSYVNMDIINKCYIGKLMNMLKIYYPIIWEKNKNVKIYLCMNVKHLKIAAWHYKNIMPIIFDVTVDDLPYLIRLTRHLPCYFVTALSIYNMVRNRYPKSNIYYIPQSISSAYIGYADSVDKDIDFIQFGRKDKILHECAIKYCKLHTGYKYIYRKEDYVLDSEMVMYSDGKEKKIGIIASREEFMSYLGRSRFALCSTPLASGARSFGDGIDFLTARWYESLIAGCHILGHWSEQADHEMQMTGLSEISDNICDYDDFDFALRECEVLDKPCLLKLINRNTTSSRAIEVKTVLEDKGCLGE